MTFKKLARLLLIGSIFTLSACGGTSDTSEENNTTSETSESTSDTNTTTDQNNENSATLPAAVQKQYTLVYSGAAVDGLTDKTSYTVTLDSDDQLIIGSKTLTNPTNEDYYNQGSTDIVWASGDYRYILSTKTDGSLNEINVVDAENETNGFPTFKGQFAETNSTTASSSSTNNSTTTPKTFNWWKLTEDSNKVNNPTHQNYLASSAALFTEDLVKDKAKLLMPGATFGDMVLNKTTDTADKAVYKVTLTGTSNSTYANAEVIYTFEKQPTTVSNDHTSQAPQKLTELAGTYTVSDTTLPEIMGYISAGHLTLELTINNDGSLAYKVKDKDDNSVIYNRTISWDGEFDEYDASNSILYLNRNFSDLVTIDWTSSWFEFHVHLPLNTTGVGNQTTNIQWNVPYKSN